MKRLLLELSMTAGLLVTVGAGTVGVAAAQDTTAGVYGSVPTTVAPYITGSNHTTDGTAPAVIDGAPTAASNADGVVPSPIIEASSNTSNLAFTGADVAGTAAAGAILLGGGAAMVCLSRRRRQS